LLITLDQERLMRVRVLTGLAGLAAMLTVSGLGVRSAEAVPALARQFDMQCNACHTRPPRLNSFGEQVHMMGFQVPSAARPGGVIEALREDGVWKTVLDSLALRIEGGLASYVTAPSESEKSFEPPHEYSLYVVRPLSPNFSIFIELKAEPNALEFDNGRFRTKTEIGIGHEAFFMWNLAGLLGLVGVPAMDMGGQSMLGQHGGVSLHGPMLMAGKVDPNTNFSYATNRQLILETETEIEDGRIERLPVVPYAFTSKFFGLFKDRDGEPLLVTDQVMYNTTGSLGADLHTMLNNVIRGAPILVDIGVLQENEGFNTYAMVRVDVGERQGLTANVSALFNYGVSVARAPNPVDPERAGNETLDRLRLGVAANVRWQQLDVYGAVIWDKLYGLPRALGGDFKGTATGLSLQVDYLAFEPLLLSARFDQLWAGGLREQRRDATVLTFQVRYYPWPNVSFFVRDSVNVQGVVEDNPLRNWRNQLVAGIDWDF
jgi:hypothetical protein